MCPTLGALCDGTYALHGVFGSFSSTSICSDVLDGVHVLCESIVAEYDGEFDNGANHDVHDNLVLFNIA